MAKRRRLQSEAQSRTSKWNWLIFFRVGPAAGSLHSAASSPLVPAALQQEARKLAREVDNLKMALEEVRKREISHG